MKEIAFFDPYVGAPPGWLVAWRYMMEAVSSPNVVKSRAVPITGQVIATHYKSRLPYFDTIWNSPDVFNRSARHFAVTRALIASRLRVSAGNTPPDLAHWTYPLAIRVPKTINIYTLHDLVPLRLPFTTLDNKRFYYALMRLLARRADHIVTVSETSKRDIINLLGVPEHRVTNTYQAVDIPAKYADKPADVVKQEVEGTFNVKYKEYMLFFGAVEPKKNVGRLIEAYLASKIDTPLLIVGKLAWKSEQEMRLMNDDATSYLEQMGSLTFRRRKIFHVDYAPFPLLVSLIKGAKAVLFPSLYEGFGLPILEAMKLGTPVLTSKEGATPEVAGEGALLVDPYDVRALTEGITALETDADLRGRLSDYGRKRAEMFSTEAYKGRLGALYDRLLAEKPHERWIANEKSNFDAWSGELRQLATRSWPGRRTSVGGGAGHAAASDDDEA